MNGQSLGRKDEGAWNGGQWGKVRGREQGNSGRRYRKAGQKGVG